MEKPTTNSKLNAALLTMAAMGIGMDAPFLFGRPKEVIPEKPCLNCGDMKRHNNSFCSAECCSAYRERKRSETR